MSLITNTTNVIDATSGSELATAFDANSANLRCLSENGIQTIHFSKDVLFRDGDFPQGLEGIHFVTADPCDGENSQLLMLRPVTVSTTGGNTQVLIQEDVNLQGLGQEVTGMIQLIGEDGQEMQVQLMTDTDHLNQQLIDVDLEQLQLHTSNAPATNQLQQLLTPISQESLLLSLPKVESEKRRASRRKLIGKPEGKGPWTCNICQTDFDLWSSFQRHIRGHEDDKPFRCSTCHETFNHEMNLRLHQAIHVTFDLKPTCPECNKSFSRLASLKAHLAIHELEESLMCSECGDEFPLQSQLDNHMNQHQNEKAGITSLNSCKICSATFDKIATLREHMKHHNQIRSSLEVRKQKISRNKKVSHSNSLNKCRFCEKKFSKPSQLSRHERIHTGERPFSCPECGKAFNQKNALVMHEKKHTGHRPHVCQFCMMRFTQKGNLRSHILRVHTDGIDGSNPFRCSACPCSFRKLGSLNSHYSRIHTTLLTMNGHSPISSKEESGIKTEGEPDKDKQEHQFQHMLKDEKSKVDNFDMNPELLQLPSVYSQGHEQQMEEGMPTDILQQALENSSLTNEAEKIKTEKSSPRVPPPSHVTTMDVQDVSTGSFKSTQVGVRKVNGVRYHQCTYCAKEFRKPSDLVRHIRIHTHEKPYKCSKCYRAFAVKSTLTAHTRSHTGIKNFQCSNCRKFFSTPGSLKVHFRLHTGSKPFQCQSCSKKFRTAGHLKTHLQSHSRDSSCRKSRRARRSDDKSELDLSKVPLQEPILITNEGLIQQEPRHQHVFGSFDHLSSRPHRCSQCSRCFKKSSHLKQHIRSHTGEKPYKCLTCSRSFVASGVLKAHIRTHSGVKAFKCRHCKMSFTTNGSLKRHLSTHSEMRPFMCPYCQKTFKTSMSCKKHMKTHRHELAVQASQAELTVDHLTDVGQSNNLITDDESTVEVAQQQNVSVSDIDSRMVALSAQQLLPASTSQLMTTDHVQSQAELLTSDQDAQFSSLVSENSDNLSVVDSAVPQYLTDQHGHPIVVNGQKIIVNSGDNIQVQLTDDNGISSNDPHQEAVNSLNVSVGNLSDSDTSRINGLTLHTKLTDQFALDAQDFSSGIAPQVVLDHQTFQQLSSAFNSSAMQSFLQESQEPLSEVSTLPTLTEDGETEDLTELRVEPRPEVVMPRARHISAGARFQSNEFACPYCSRSCRKSAHLQTHIKTHSSVSPVSCESCQRMFATEEALNAHKNTDACVREYSCSKCDMMYPTMASLDRHSLTHPPELSCQICNITFSTVLKYKQHRREKHSSSPTGSRMQSKQSRSHPRTSTAEFVQISKSEAVQLYKTLPHDQLSLSQRLFVQSTVEGDEPDKISEKPISIGPVHAHTCSSCPKSFKKPSDLARHERIHSGEKPFICKHCSRAFTVKSTLDSHIRTHMQIGKRFKCHVCSAPFSTKGSLKVHMRLHTGSKPFKCPQCDQRFRTSGHKQSHLQSHFKTPKKQVTTNLVNVNLGDSIPMQLLGDGFVLTPSTDMTSDKGNSGTIQIQLTNSQGQNINIPSVGLEIDPNLLSQLQQAVPKNGSLSLNVNTNSLSSGNEQILLPQVSLDQALSIGSSFEQIPILNQSKVFTNDGLALLNVNNESSMNDGRNFDQLNKGGMRIQDQSLLNSGPLNVTVKPDLDINQTLSRSGEPSDLDSVLGAVEGLSGTTVSLMGRSLMMPDPSSQMQVRDVSPTELMNVNVASPSEMMNTEQSAASIVGNEQDLMDRSSQVVSPSEMIGNDDDQIEHEVSNIPMNSAGLLLSGVGSLKGHSNFLKLGASPKYNCKICDRVFKTIAGLTDHMAGAHSQEILNDASAIKYKKSQVCPHCNKFFGKPSQLQRHIRIHTGERPFVCHVCTRAFNQKNALQMHQKKHSGEKPHGCPYCNQNFSQKGNLKTHINRTHHKEMLQPSASHLHMDEVTQNVMDVDGHLEDTKISEQQDIASMTQLFIGD